MRNALLLLTVVAAVVFAVLLLHNNSQAAITIFNEVEGHALNGSNYLTSYTIQASANGTSNWVDVATTDDGGYYDWKPNAGWSNGWIYMRVKPHCNDFPGGVNPSDNPIKKWNYYSTSNYKTTVDVHGSCP